MFPFNKKKMEKNETDINSFLTTNISSWCKRISFKLGHISLFIDPDIPYNGIHEIGISIKSYVYANFLRCVILQKDIVKSLPRLTQNVSRSCEPYPLAIVSLSVVSADTSLMGEISYGEFQQSQRLLQVGDIHISEERFKSYMRLLEAGLRIPERALDYFRVAGVVRRNMAVFDEEYILVFLCALAQLPISEIEFDLRARGKLDEDQLRYLGANWERVCELVGEANVSSDLS